MPMRLTRGWMEIDLDAVVRNARAMAGARAAILPMVKADAYGMGAVPVVRALEQLAPWGYGVATIDEGIELRDAGIDRPIVLFTSVGVDELRRCARRALTPALASRIGDLCVARARRQRVASRDRHGNVARRRSLGRRARALDALARASARGCLHALSLGLARRWIVDRAGEAFRASARRRFPRLRNCCTPRTRPRSRGAIDRVGVLDGREFFSMAWGLARTRSCNPSPCSPFARALSSCARVRAGETVSYDATFAAKREIAHRDASDRIRRWLPALARQPRPRARCGAQSAGGGRRDDGHDDARRHGTWRRALEMS